jgi:hypothetical protein
LEIEVADSVDFRRTQSEVFESLIDSITFVNGRYIEQNKATRLALIFV